MERLSYLSKTEYMQIRHDSGMNRKQSNGLLVLSEQKKKKINFKIWATILNYHKETIVHASQRRSADLYQMKVQHEFMVLLSYTSSMTSKIHCEIIS